MSDTKSFFSKNYGWDAGVGDRNGRWAMVIDKDGSIVYAEAESDFRQVTVSTNQVLNPRAGEPTDDCLRFPAPMRSSPSYKRP